MSDGGITVLDGTHLRSLRFALPDVTTATSLTGANLLDLAETRASQSLFGLSLPQTLKSSALSRLHLPRGVVTFRQSELTPEAALETLNDYITAIADELKENPVAVSILDGDGLRMFLEDEDDFAMVAENLFTDLDTVDRGKITKSELKNAVLHMGVEMGVPSFEEFPQLNDILRKHGVEEEVELGQSQFAESLLPILQEIADALAENHVVVIHKIKIVNGSLLRKLLADEDRLNDVTGKMLQEKHGRNNHREGLETIRDFLEKNGKALGLPQSEASEAVAHLYDAVFTEAQSGEGASMEDDQFSELVKEIIVKFADQLEANPIYYDLGSFG